MCTVYSDFRILNEKLLKINHTFPLVRDCIEQLGRKRCHYLRTIDLRDAFHTLRLATSSQKYCGITPCSIARPGSCSLKLEGIKAREINAKSP